MLVILTSHPIQYQAPLWRALARAGVKFEVWFLTPHGQQASYDAEFGRTFAWDVDLLAGYPHRFVPVEAGWRLDRFNGIRPTQAWADAFREHDVTHLWIEGWRFRCLWSAVFAAKRNGIKVWLRGESHALAPESWHRRFWKRPLLRYFFSHVNAFLCIGTANREFYRMHGIQEARLLHAPYCVDNDLFARQAAALGSKRDALRAAWGITPKAFTLLFCGKLITKKSPLDVIAAARHAITAIQRPVHLLFVGDGELAPRLREELSGPGTPPGTLVGFLNQGRITEAFVAADCLILPSDYGETWGLVVNEALAAGIPAIVSDHCGCAADLGKPQGPAHVFPFANIESLARSIQSVEANPPSRESLGVLIDSHHVSRTVETVTTHLRSG